MLLKRPTRRAAGHAALLAFLLTSLPPLGAIPVSAETLALTEPAPSAPEITLEPDAVSVTGVTPGGSLAWILLTHQRVGYYPVTRYGAEILVDDDGDGSVRIEPADGIPAMALFLVVDLTTGEGSWIAPEGFEPRVLDLPSEALARGASGRLDRLTRTRGEALHNGLHFGGVSRARRSAYRYTRDK